MTDERDKTSRGQESVARTTARDVPFTRSAEGESESAPQGQRPAQLPRDPTYEAELANVELAVLRDRDRRDDPSTKQGGRRGHQLPPGQPPESVTPESPGARATREVAIGRSPEPPSSSGRTVASGTLLSIGAVDPRGKTERTLETPRMFFSHADAAGEAYFRPGKIPAVTVHQTLETETVKLADSVDPRRAKTLPRIDRNALARFAEREVLPDSEAPVAFSEPGSLDVDRESASPRWNQDEYDPTSFPSDQRHDGQIHASLSPFRDQGEPSYDDGVPTRVEPLAGRRASDPPEPTPPPDPSTVPTHRDLPMHRIEASNPPPPPSSASFEALSQAHSDSAVPGSEGPSPTTASIAADEPKPRPIWLNLAAFGVALLLALAIGWWLTSHPASEQASPSVVPPATLPKRADPATIAPAPPAPELAPVEAAKPAQAKPAAPAKARPVIVSPPAAPAAVGAPASSPGARKSAPTKSTRETIF
jgi:hypothetical protein